MPTRLTPPPHRGREHQPSPVYVNECQRSVAALNSLNTSNTNTGHRTRTRIERGQATCNHAAQHEQNAPISARTQDVVFAEVVGRNIDETCFPRTRICCRDVGTGDDSECRSGPESGGWKVARLSLSCRLVVSSSRRLVDACLLTTPRDSSS